MNPHIDFSCSFIHFKNFTEFHRDKTRPDKRKDKLSNMKLSPETDEPLTLQRSVWQQLTWIPHKAPGMVLVEAAVLHVKLLVQVL